MRAIEFTQAGLHFLGKIEKGRELRCESLYSGCGNAVVDYIQKADVEERGVELGEESRAEFGVGGMREIEDRKVGKGFGEAGGVFGRCNTGHDWNYMYEYE